MSFLPMFLQFLTGTNFLPVLILDGSPRSSAICDVNVTDVECLAPPMDPNIGLYEIGSVVGIAALGSPIREYAIIPPLIISLGLMPKNCGVQTTMSASFPGSNDPTYCDIPCVIAGFIVILAR